MVDVPDADGSEEDVLSEEESSTVGAAVEGGAGRLVVAVANPAGTMISVAWSAVMTTIDRAPPVAVVPVPAQAAPTRAGTTTGARNTRGAARHRAKWSIGH